MLVVRFTKNEKGRDYIVGDIHGNFTKLENHLKSIGFNNENGDRLFSVGDLVDRGPESEMCIDWVSKDWFFPVQGNHEDMAIRWPNGHMDKDNYIANGGMWNVNNDKSKSKVISDVLSLLPIAIEIETLSGLVGIVHADCPAKVWQDFIDVLEDKELTKRHVQTAIDAAMWSRLRIENRNIIPPENVEGVRAVIVGHTPLQSPTWVGNVFHIDTAGWHPNGYGFTVIDAETLEVVNPIDTV